MFLHWKDKLAAFLRLDFRIEGLIDEQGVCADNPERIFYIETLNPVILGINILRYHLAISICWHYNCRIFVLLLHYTHLFFKDYFIWIGGILLFIDQTI